jgi:translation initiation factor 2-alpha kinase 1
MNCLHLYETGVLDSVSFLSDMGLVSDSEIKVIEASLKSSSLAGGGSLKSYFANSAASLNALNDIENINTSRYMRDFLEIGVLGKGGFGTVFKAQHRLDGREYAIKKVQFYSEGYDGVMHRKVLREVQMLSSLDHPNVCRYHSAWLEPRWLLPRSAGVLDKPSVQKKLLQDVRNVVDATGSSSDPSSYVDQSYVERSYVETSYSLYRETLNGEDDDMFRVEDYTEETTSEYRKYQRNSSSNFSPRHAPVSYYSEESTEIFTEITSSVMKLTDIVSSEYLTTERKKTTTKIAHEEYREPPPVDSGKGTDRKMEGTEFWKSSFRYELNLFIQMQLCGPRTLREWIDERNLVVGAIDLIEVCTYAEQLTSGLAHIHSIGVIHRDLKPANIFLNPLNNNLRIGDFGLSKLNCATTDNIPPVPAVTETALVPITLQRSPSTEFSTSAHTASVGTHSYASPEQLSDTVYDEKSDVYSIGLVLLELFTIFGSAMERAKVFEAARKCPPLLPSTLKDRYPEVHDIIAKCLDKDPMKRPSALELNYMECLRTSPVMEHLKAQLKEKDKVIAEQERAILELREQLKEKGQSEPVKLRRSTSM